MDSLEKLEKGESIFYTMEVKQKKSGSSDSLGETVCKKTLPNKYLKKDEGSNNIGDVWFGIL
jgi:hypothetical protein